MRDLLATLTFAAAIGWACAVHYRAVGYAEGTADIGLLEASIVQRDAAIDDLLTRYAGRIGIAEQGVLACLVEADRAQHAVLEARLSQRWTGWEVTP
jgi:hypothetical protein